MTIQKTFLFKAATYVHLYLFICLYAYTRSENCAFRQFGVGRTLIINMPTFIYCYQISLVSLFKKRFYNLKDLVFSLKNGLIVKKKYTV